MNMPLEQTNDSSGSESIEGWDSFTMYVLLDEIETEFKVQFSLDEILAIKTIKDFKQCLKKHGVQINDKK